MPKTFTNVPRTGAVTVPQSVVNRPFVSKGPYSTLTAKEKTARLMTKKADIGMTTSFNTTTSMQGNFFSPQLSTDFLELPQSIRERRELYRHYYNSDPIVGQAIDLHTELPLSKIRLGTPKPSTYPEGFKDQHDYASYILWFFEEMCNRIKLFQRLETIVFLLWLEGGAFIFTEDSTVEVPQEVGYDRQDGEVESVITADGEAKEEREDVWTEREDKDDQELAYYQKHYKGWERMIILPHDQVKVTSFSFTERMKMELIPSEKDRALIEQAKAGDEFAQEMVKDFPDEVREHIEQEKLIPLGQDPDEGSFCYYISNRRAPGEDLGQSILDRCHLPQTPVLTLRDGMVQQVPIEDLDPERDKVLGPSGQWREFEVGGRPVIDESMRVIRLAKVHPPIGCTQDHRYPVLRDSVVKEVPAAEIVPGDYLQIPMLPLAQSMLTVDLAEFVPKIGALEYRGKRSGRSSLMRLQAVDTTQHSFLLRYEKEETDPRLIGRTWICNAILSWASTLTESVTMRSAQACEMFGVNAMNLKEIRRQLVEAGYGVRVSKDKFIVWPPNLDNIEVSTVAACIRGPFRRQLKLDGELGYVLGYFLGDGYVTSLDKIGPTFNVVYASKNERSNASGEYIKKVLEQLGGKLAEYSGRSRGWVSCGMRLVVLSNDAFAFWVQRNFGAVCEDKRLPEWVFDCPREFLWGLLRGFVDSDGSVSRKQDGSVSVLLSNTNPVLADQLLLVCTSLGIPASKTVPTKARPVRQATGVIAMAKPMYCVHFTHGPTIKSFFESGFLAKRVDLDVCKNGRSGTRHILHDGKLYYRVMSVDDTVPYTGPVYSLNVHEDHSFFAGYGLTSNCLRLLNFKEKLRQAQTQIASRNMTPKRIVWGDRISEADVMDLREQVDLALVDPDYSIVANYEVHWEEMGSRDRLLDLSTEYESIDKQLYAGLGVTESLLSGEAIYSGDRLKLEVINTRYLFLRDRLQEYVENYLFKPVARRKGFVEKNQWGGEVVLIPKLSFTRLPLRDSQDTYDALFNLYSKGSIDISVILDLFGLDPTDIKQKLKEDMYTVNDALFNEVLRGAYGAASQPLVEGTDLVDKLIQAMNLTKKPPPEQPPEEGRF